MNHNDDDQLIHIRGLETEPAKMWERLKTVHETTGVTGSATDLWTQFHTATYTDSSIPLRNHISTIRSYTEALDRLHSDKPSDTQIIARIFTSLPPSYSTIIKILKKSDNANNLDYITECILAEETTQKSADNSMICYTGSVNALMATLKLTLVCINPVCKAANRLGHVIENCFWPGGGKDGQWSEWWFKSRGIPADSSTSAVTATLVSGDHFVL
jgi:gag-polypeptide of LTR copia-type